MSGRTNIFLGLQLVGWTTVVVILILKSKGLM
jgi:hypothetical protein